MFGYVLSFLLSPLGKALAAVLAVSVMAWWDLPLRPPAGPHGRTGVIRPMDQPTE